MSTAFGNVFVSDNDDDGNRGSRMIWIMDGGNHGYRMPGSSRHWAEELPGVIPKLVGTGNGSPSGILLVESPLFGKEVEGQILQVDAGTRQVNLHPLVRKGAGYRSDYKVFLKGEDPWFRPIDIALAPDGTLYLCDWYDAGVGGHAFADQSTGRIYHIRPKENPISPAEPDFKSIAGLIKGLGSPNPRHAVCRETRTPLDRGSGRRGPLRDAYREGSLRTRGRILFVLSALAQTGQADVLAALKDPEPMIREQALRILTRDDRKHGMVDDTEAKKIEPRAMGVLDEILPLATDPDAGVRRELLLALRDVPTAPVEKELTTLAKSWDGKDRFFLEALRLALVHREAEYLARLFDVLSDGVKAKDSVTALAQPPYFPTATNDAYLRVDDEFPGANAASKLVGISWVLERPECLPSLEKVIAIDHSPSIGQGVELVLERIADPRGAAFLTRWHSLTSDAGERRSILKLLGRKLAGPWQSERESAAVRDLFTASLAEPGMEVETIRAIDSAGDRHFDDRLLQLAKDSEKENGVRSAALETLGRGGNEAAVRIARDWVESTRGEPAAGPLAATGLSVAIAGDRKAALQLLINVVGDKAYPADLRRKGVGLIALDTPGARRLLTLFADGKLPEDVRTEAVFLLHNHPDEKIRRVAANRIPLPKIAGGTSLARLDDVLSKQGNVENGERLFRRDASDACARCHRVQGVGNWVGPDLSSIGTKYGARELLYHVLNPSGAIGDNYVPQVVALADGRLLTGLVADESADRLVLKTAAGERISLATSEIEDRRPQNQSIMPENLAQSFSLQELADLIAFLGTLKVPVTEVGECFLLGPVKQGAFDGSVIPDVERPVNLLKDSGVTARWQPTRTSKDMYLDLSSILGTKEGNEVFVYVPTISPSTQKARIVLTTSNVVSLWLNGKPVPLTGPVQQGSIRFWQGTLDMNEGANALVIKLASGGVEAGLVTTLVAQEQIRIQLPSKVESP
ncbi:MAG: c-type cytochrome, partial [Planctomycetota bacterium]